ncbi:MAG TPA: hypothetical protein VGL47_25790 [Amycolatopsis sp.]|uniref:hypothetical protein n=1 Tax=Amycolatopsis sp. TaxID=37632 RepID=UPI002F428828
MLELLRTLLDPRSAGPALALVGMWMIVRLVQHGPGFIRALNERAATRHARTAKDAETREHARRVLEILRRSSFPDPPSPNPPPPAARAGRRLPWRRSGKPPS